ncbi:MAG: hypothetical protein CVV27_11995 [Candidatus Melainabacteria bacterium HGW-Melainabacteria-1]|nr:MAG: hypothetical protein CVV27_11995 [Candidatus Melainabacteria bacterium HGW-Melainabacteria-1]
MQIGIIGTQQDKRCQGISQFLEQQGVEAVFVDSCSLQEQAPWSFDGSVWRYLGRDLGTVSAWYMATYPPAMPASWTDYEDHYLYQDWYIDYMHKREHRGFMLAWLSSLVQRGVPVINPPEHMFGQQLKPLELQLAREVGLEIPKTLISNDPEAVRAFVAELPDVVYKPLTGYGICRPVSDAELRQLDRLKASPVIFQQRVQGTAVRATFVDRQLISAARLPSESLDYRNDAEYEAGRQVYQPMQLPEPIVSACQAYLERAGLLFAGIDLIETADGRYVFLEANSSPMYLELEIRTRHPITFELATALLKYANDPKAYGEAKAAGRQKQGFVPYVLPFGKDLWT